MTRPEVLEHARAHLDQAANLLAEVEMALKAGDRAEIVRLQGGETVARAAAHAAVGQGLVALATAEEPAPSVPDEPMGQLCGHNRGVLRRYAPEGAMGPAWLHATDMSRCDSPPTG